MVILGHNTAIALDNKSWSVWFDRTRAQELGVEHEIFVPTQVRSKLNWRRAEPLNVEPDVIERWKFTEDQEYLKVPHLKNRIDFGRATMLRQLFRVATSFRLLPRTFQAAIFRKPV